MEKDYIDWRKNEIYDEMNSDLGLKEWTVFELGSNWVD